MATLKTDFSDGDIFYSGAITDTDKLNGITNTINSGAGVLGEVRMFALSMTGAVTKATLQGYGWAICDGTTPASQGISSPTIATTPNLEDKFIKMSDDETSGNTGGSETHNHNWIYEETGGGAYDYKSYNSAGTAITFNVQNFNAGTSGYGYKASGNENDGFYTEKIDTKPPFYELVYFIKVK